MTKRVKFFWKDDPNQEVKDFVGYEDVWRWFIEVYPVNKDIVIVSIA
jgi:hypothetical protein